MAGGEHSPLGAWTRVDSALGARRARVARPAASVMHGYASRVSGYREHADWRDMSDFVVHFTKDYDGRTAYDNSLSILYDGVIRATTAYGQARTLVGLGSSQRCACFSEIPLDLIDRLVQRRTWWGASLVPGKGRACGVGVPGREGAAPVGRSRPE